MQSLGTHQENAVFGYAIALGCVVGPNSAVLAEQSVTTPGGTKPVFNATDVAAVLSATPNGQTFLGRLKSGFVVKTADVSIPTFDAAGNVVRDASGRAIAAGPASGLMGGYARGTTAPGLIILNNFAASTGGFKGTDAQFYAYVLIQEVNEHDLFVASTAGNSKTVEIINRVNAETQARQMGLPESQPGYRTLSGAPNVGQITNDVNRNTAYQGATHGNTYIIRNGVVVPWP